MTTFSQSVEDLHKVIIPMLLSLIAVFVIACSLNDILPICHYIFGCDHLFHAG